MKTKQAFRLAYSMAALLAISHAIAEARVNKSLDAPQPRQTSTATIEEPSILPKVPDFASGGFDRWVPSGQGPVWTLSTGDTQNGLFNHLMDTHGFRIEQVQDRTILELIGLHSDAHNGLINARRVTDECPTGV